MSAETWPPLGVGAGARCEQESAELCASEALRESLRPERSCPCVPAGAGGCSWAAGVPWRPGLALRSLPFSGELFTPVKQTTLLCAFCRRGKFSSYGMVACPRARG